MNLKNIYKAVILVYLVTICNLIHSQSVGINTTGVAPNTSALLDVDVAPTNNKGLLLPRLSTVERNAIVAPAQSLLIYNTTDSCYQGYIGTQWISFGCVGSDPVTLQPSCGTQVWAVANLDAGNMVNSTTSGTQQPSPFNVKYCFNNIAANCAIYGGLYEWNNVMLGAASSSCDPCGTGGVQGMCPSGYHIPTDLEWSRYEFCLENTISPTGATTLATFQTGITFRGTNSAAGPSAKMKVTSGNTPAWDGTNTSGFSALPSGFRATSTGLFNALGTNATFWSATEANGTNAFARYLYSGAWQSARNIDAKTGGFSIRCIKN